MQITLLAQTKESKKIYAVMRKYQSSFFIDDFENNPITSIPTKKEEHTSTHGIVSAPANVENNNILNGENMNRRHLGSGQLLVSSLGLGCMGMSEFYGAYDDAESIRVIHAYLDAGGNFLDTADMYGSGRNEELVGKAIAGRSDSVVVATKFGVSRGPNGEFTGVHGDKKYVTECCEASLRRLKIDAIDLYYQHRVDPAVEIEETVSAMKDLLKAGKVKHLGLSEAAPETIRRAYKVHPIDALQTEYSLWSRECEGEIFPVTEELRIGFVAYSPLGRGFLTGAIKSIDDLAPDDYRRFSPRFQGENFQKNLVLVAKIKEIAASKKITPSQLALAWVLAKSAKVVPIPGTRRLDFLKDNIGALNVKLTETDLSDINAALPNGSSSGDRYPEHAMKAVNL